MGVAGLIQLAWRFGESGPHASSKLPLTSVQLFANAMPAGSGSDMIQHQLLSIAERYPCYCPVCSSRPLKVPDRQNANCVTEVKSAVTGV